MSVLVHCEPYLLLSSQDRRPNSDLSDLYPQFRLQIHSSAFLAAMPYLNGMAYVDVAMKSMWVDSLKCKGPLQYSDYRASVFSVV